MIVIKKNPSQKPPKGMHEISAMHLGRGVWMIRYEAGDSPNIDELIAKGKTLKKKIHKQFHKAIGSLEAAEDALNVR